VTSTFTFDGIGTRWDIVTDLPLDARLRALVLDRVEAFDITWSRFREDSLVTRLAQGGPVTFPEEARALFDLYDALSEATGGAVDPLVGRDLELWGYDADYTLVPASREAREAHRAQGQPLWRDRVRRDGTTVTGSDPVLIDVGAAGKGLLVDILGQLLHDEGVESNLVDGSGDMRRRGSGTDRIGLEHPLEPERVIGVVELRDSMALCASSTTRRTWGPGLHHVLDARTGWPVRDVLATWVTADDCRTADGLTTALFTTPASRLARDFDFASILMTVDGEVETWGEFPGELFSNRPTHTTRTHF